MYPTTAEELALLPLAPYLSSEGQAFAGPPAPDLPTARANALMLLSQQHGSAAWEAWIVHNTRGAVVAGYRREHGVITVIHEG